MPLLSVIVPVFNTDPYLERCVDSILSQSFSDFEVLLVDDGSIDESGTICDEYARKDDRIRVFHKENGGICSARNFGLKAALGEWFFFLDSDDWLEVDAFELLFRKQMENDTDLVWGKRFVYETNGRYIWAETDYKNKEQLVIRMMQRSWDHFVTGKLIRRSLFVSNGLQWKEGLDVAEDRRMMALLSYYANSFDSVDHVIYNYERCNVNSITNTHNGQKILRNNRQELGNLFLMEQFFNDKESVYQKECARCVVEQLVFNLHATLSFSDKSEYKDIVGRIDKRSDDELRQIGWKKTGLKGWIIHHFRALKYYRKCAKIPGRAKKYLHVFCFIVYSFCFSCVCKSS